MGVGETQTLKRGQDVPAGRSGGAALGQEAREFLIAQTLPQVGLQKPEDEQGETHHGDQSGDAIVVMQKQRPLRIPAELTTRFGFN